MVLTTTLYCDSNFGRHFICFSNRIHKDINYYIMKVNRFGKCGSTLTHIGPQAEHKKIYRVPMGTHMYPWYGTHGYPYVMVEHYFIKGTLQSVFSYIVQIGIPITNVHLHWDIISQIIWTKAYIGWPLVVGGCGRVFSNVLGSLNPKVTFLQVT